MKISLIKSGKHLYISAFVAIFICCLGCRTDQTQVNNQTKVTALPTVELQKNGESRKWSPGSYEGIEIGKSTRQNVIEKFGKPVWEGEEEIEGEEADVQNQLEAHGGKRLMLEYRNVEKFDGGITVLYGERNQIVRAVSLYPKEPFPKEIIVKKYGEDFIALNSNEEICAAVASSREKAPMMKDELPSTLIYPQTGMLISLIKTNQKVDRVDYLLTCKE